MLLALRAWPICSIMSWQIRMVMVTIAYVPLDLLRRALD